MGCKVSKVAPTIMKKKTSQIDNTHVRVEKRSISSDISKEKDNLNHPTKNNILLTHKEILKKLEHHSKLNLALAAMVSDLLSLQKNQNKQTTSTKYCDTVQRNIQMNRELEDQSNFIIEVGNVEHSNKSLVPYSNIIKRIDDSKLCCSGTDTKNKDCTPRGPSLHIGSILGEIGHEIHFENTPNRRLGSKKNTILKTQGKFSQIRGSDKMKTLKSEMLSPSNMMRGFEYQRIGHQGEEKLQIRAIQTTRNMTHNVRGSTLRLPVLIREGLYTPQVGQRGIALSGFEAGISPIKKDNYFPSTRLGKGVGFNVMCERAKKIKISELLER